MGTEEAGACGALESFHAGLKDRDRLNGIATITVEDVVWHVATDSSVAVAVACQRPTLGEDACVLSDTYRKVLTEHLTTPKWPASTISVPLLRESAGEPSLVIESDVCPECKGAGTVYHACGCGRCPDDENEVECYTCDGGGKVDSSPAPRPVVVEGAWFDREVIARAAMVLNDAGAAEARVWIRPFGSNTFLMRIFADDIRVVCIGMRPQEGKHVEMVSLSEFSDAPV